MSLSFVAVDIEATGMSHQYDSILSIGAVRVENGEVTGKFYELIHITKKFRPFSENIRKLGEQCKEEGKQYELVLAEFMLFIDDLPMVAHNVAFDHRMLAHKIKNKLGFDFNPTRVCSMQVARVTYPKLKNHKLDTVANHLGILNLNHHHALNDAEVAADIILMADGLPPKATKTGQRNNPNLELLKRMRGYY